MSPSAELFDDFDGPGLDTEVWVPHYLPQWSSRAESAATYAFADSELRLSVPPEQGLWCAADHEPPLRVSGIQSGVFSGPVGGTVGQQPFRDGAIVREAQPARWGVDAAPRADRGARPDGAQRTVDGAVWMVGIEDLPHRSAELCIFEVFGDAIDEGRSAAVGVGVHPFRDPAIVDEFAAARVVVDVGEPHVYAADWGPGRVDFMIDGERVRTVEQAPDYPMQMMVGVFDFPERAASAPAEHVPLLAVDWVRGG